MTFLADKNISQSTLSALCHPPTSSQTLWSLALPLGITILHSAFWMSPYSRALTSTILSSTLTSGSKQCCAMSPETTQTSFKGKGSLTQIKADLEAHLDGLNKSSIEQWYNLTMLKNECKSLRVQAYMCNKEIANLAAENDKDCAEAEKIHFHELEKKRMDIDSVWKSSSVWFFCLFWKDQDPTSCNWSFTRPCNPNPKWVYPQDCQHLLHLFVLFHYTLWYTFTTLFTTHCIVHLSKKEIDVIMLYLHHHDDDRGYL